MSVPISTTLLISSLSDTDAADKITKKMTRTIPSSSLIFPSASTSLSTTLSQLKRSNLSLPNRLRSIASDAVFVQKVADELNLPLIANERCGSWYIPTSCKEGSAYFKSTDGHHGQWAFSLRRLNLQVLDVICRDGRGGCIIVDSTRKGKSMPDALSKTVPIWICVLNRLLFPEDEESRELRTPENVVSRSEHVQIEQRLPQFVTEARSLALDLEALRVKLNGRPMVPLWVTPDSELPLQKHQDADYNLVVLCTASSRSSSSGSLGSTYVQGAADDCESWALGLDAATFWSYSEQLLSTSEDDLPDVIEEIIADSQAQRSARALTLIRPTGNIWLGSNETAERQHADFDVVVSCSEKPSDAVATKLKDRYLNLSCGTGKVGSRQLRTQLPKLENFAAVIDPFSRVLVTCHTGKNLAVGVALALICRFCNEAGEISTPDADASHSKSLIKHRLSWIMVSMPDAAPSRATLQSVNAFLLG